MMISASRNLHIIIGLGVTGLSCAHYLSKKGIPFAVTDSRFNPPGLLEFKAAFPTIPVFLGQLNHDLLHQAERLIVSPGVSLSEPPIAEQIAKGVPAIGDIELFAEAVDSDYPVIAITGTNAKSTVTTLVGEMAVAAGYCVGVGGNLGVPALHLLTTPMPSLFVLELSSFQLDTTYSLCPQVATVLNITPDHLDRYGTIEHYYQAKQRIYSNCKIAVCNRDDMLTECHAANVQQKFYFTLNVPQDNEFGLRSKNHEWYLAFQDQILMPIKDLPILGRHYQANALASLAIGHAVGLPFAPMLEVLTKFKGLPHRCQLVRELNQVHWYNDSKGTNVGATLAAIEGLGSVIQGKMILIAGGVGKGADFAPLVPAIEKYVKTVVLIGEAASILADVIGGRVDTCFADSMEEAVNLSNQAALPGDSVLLSPACASFDMFNNFEHRGEVFSEIVNHL